MRGRRNKLSLCQSQRFLTYKENRVPADLLPHPTPVSLCINESSTLWESQPPVVDLSRSKFCRRPTTFQHRISLQLQRNAAYIKGGCKQESKVVICKIPFLFLFLFSVLFFLEHHQWWQIIAAPRDHLSLHTWFRTRPKHTLHHFLCKIFSYNNNQSFQCHTLHMSL